MKILYLSPGIDVAGLGAGMRAAFLEAGHDARHVRLSNNVFDYPVDIEWDRNDADQTAEVMEIWNEADVVHIFEKPGAAHWFPGWREKAIVVHHLGTYYRLNQPVVTAQCAEIGALECADMHDLIRRAPGPMRWLPDIIDPAPLSELRAASYRRSPKVRIAHAPTNRTYKSTGVIMPILERLATRLPVEIDLIEGVTNAECVRRKAACDLFVDELTLGYGLNALECWSMGIPDVSGVADVATAELMRADFGGTLPFVAATEATLEQLVERLVDDRHARERWGEEGRAHVERFHSPEAVVARALAFYLDAIVGVRA